MMRLYPWIVPNDKLETFCNSIWWSPDFFIQSIMRHDDKNYCVVSKGSNPCAATELRKILRE